MAGEAQSPNGGNRRMACGARAGPRPRAHAPLSGL